MLVAAHDRIYNLATFSLLEKGGAFGGVKVHMPGIVLDVSFKEHNHDNPVSMEVLVAVITGSGPHQHRINDWDQFREAYYAVEARMNTRGRVGYAVSP